MAMDRNYKSMPRIVFIAKLVISKIQVKISIGLFLKEAVVQLITECNL